jgi:hypothetical protein
MAREPTEFEGVPRDHVLEVLRQHGVDVFESEGTTYLTKNDVHKAFNLPDRLHRRMLHQLSRTFGVPVHFLFRPELLN